MSLVYAKTNQSPEFNAIKRRDDKIMYYLERAITNPEDRGIPSNTQRKPASNNKLTNQAITELRAFTEFMQHRGNKPNTLFNYIGKLASMCRALKKAPSQLTIKDYQNYYSTVKLSTRKAIFKAAFVYYLKYTKNTAFFDEYVEALGVPKSPHKKKSIREMLTQEKLNKLLRAANNYRDRAFIACLFETGCRISEFLNIRMKDIDFSAKERDGAAPVYITITHSKTAEGENRVVRIVNSYPLLVKYLELEHPYRNAPGFRRGQYPLWCDRFKNAMDRGAAYTMLRLTAKRTDLEDFHIYNHLFRSSRINDLRYNWGLEWEEIQELMGHRNINTTVGSYFAVDHDKIDAKLTKGAAESREEREKRIAEYVKKVSPRYCLNCDRELHSTAEFCDTCGTPCDVEAAERIIKERQEEKEQLTERLLSEARAKLLSELDELVKKRGEELIKRGEQNGQ